MFVMIIELHNSIQQTIGRAATIPYDNHNIRPAGFINEVKK